MSFVQPKDVILNPKSYTPNHNPRDHVTPAQVYDFDVAAAPAKVVQYVREELQAFVRDLDAPRKGDGGEFWGSLA